MATPDCTLVTACFDLSKYNKSGRSFQENIIKFTPFYSLPIYLVIYCSPNIEKILMEGRKKYGLENMTLIISQEYEDLWISKYTDKVKKNREIYWPTKDDRTCAESHLICCSKFDFVLRTIEKNPFKTSKFGWIDGNIGISTNNKFCEDYSPNKLLYILSNLEDKFYIQRLNVIDKKYKEQNNKKEYYNQYRWLVCGCLFICNTELGLKILNKLNEIFIETTELGYGHGEEMLYLEVLDEFYDDFHFSYGDYGQIINNFYAPSKNINYIFKYILKNFFIKNYHRESYDCSKILLGEIISHRIYVDYSIFFEILFINYVSSYYYKRDESKDLVDIILSLCSNNPLLKVEFEKKKDFYMKQFSYVLH